MTDLDAEYVRQILHYDPETGVFTWRKRPREHFKSPRAYSTWNTRFAGKIAGYVGPNGYRTIAINYAVYRANRLAWFYMNDEWPSFDIDHKNREKSDDRFANLREATMSENIANSRLSKRNTSGFKGVCWDKQYAKWRASICVRGKQIFLGLFDCPKSAHEIYIHTARLHFGEFASDGHA